MNVCLTYSGYTRTWAQCRPNHEANLSPAPRHAVHYNETEHNLVAYERDEWGYSANKAPETWPENTMNMWHNMYYAFLLAPMGMDVYVRIRYDIFLEGAVDFSQYEYPDDRVYIPIGNDFRDGVNDQFAFGSYAAMTRYFRIYLDHWLYFKEGKQFHSESYLKYNLDFHGVAIERLPFSNRIVRQ